MSALDSLTLISIPPEDEALRAPVRAFLTDALRRCPPTSAPNPGRVMTLTSAVRWRVKAGWGSRFRLNTAAVGAALLHAS